MQTVPEKRVGWIACDMFDEILRKKDANWSSRKLPG
jgi:hypothetical protein